MSSDPPRPTVRPDVLERARQLEGLIERLNRCTPPDSLDRANLVSRLEKLVRWFEEPERRTWRNSSTGSP
jgi:hypothetical protein